MTLNWTAALKEENLLTIKAHFLQPQNGYSHHISDYQSQITSILYYIIFLLPGQFIKFQRDFEQSA